MNKRLYKDLKLFAAMISAGTLLYSVLRILKETSPEGGTRG